MVLLLMEPMIVLLVCHLVVSALVYLLTVSRVMSDLVSIIILILALSVHPVKLLLEVHLNV